MMPSYHNSLPQGPQIDTPAAPSTLAAGPGSEPFGAALRAIRKRRHLTQGQLAALMRQSTSYISLLESNQRRPTESVLGNLKLAIDQTSSPLTIEEEQRLAAAAAVSDPIAQLLQHAIATLSSGADANELQRALIRDDVERVIRGYLGLLRGYQRLNASRFQQARDEFDALTGPEGWALPATVRASADVALADVALKQGDPEGARQAIERALDLLDNALSPDTLALQAEARAFQGMIALRAGAYSQSQIHMKAALDLYKQVDAAASNDPDVAAIGLTKSYNRMGLLALLMGNPALARSYCASAYDALKRVSPNPHDLTDPRRLRLLALEAWANAEDQQYAIARTQREQALAAYERLRDPYGIAKTHLYMADDARLEIQATVEPPSVPPVARATDRITIYGQRLSAQAMRALVDRAKEDYLQAIDGFGQLGEALLLSRAHRGLGDMLRYQALRDSAVASERFADSQRSLQRALDLEERARQERLKPGAIESLAKVEWDQGHLAAARDLFASAIQRLNTLKTPEDVSANRQWERCMLALEVVRAEISALSSATPIGPAPILSALAAGQAPQLSIATASDDWRALFRRLARAVARAITRHHATPDAPSSLSLEWTQLLYQLDERRGSRLVAQGDFSTSHERHPLRGLELATDDRAADLHVARFFACESRIMEAHAERPGDAYVDICVRQVVADSIQATGALNNHAHLRATEVLRRLRDLGNGYHLLIVDEPMPIHFFLKGDTALVELTPEAATLDPSLSAEFAGGASEICYAFHDAETISVIKDVFEDMRRIAEPPEGANDAAIAWLTSLLGDGAARQQAGGSKIKPAL